MKSQTFASELRRATLATIVLGLVLCGAYPLIVYSIGQLLFPDQANGSLIRNTQGQVVGSALLAQAFDDALYFHPRPSAAGNGYDAANSSGSNLGPTSQKLANLIAERANSYRVVNNLSSSAHVPIDAVTASASGLDPHISLTNAQLQAARVAQARNMNVSTVHRLIQENTVDRQFGILGEPGVNVLTLNLALDNLRQ